MRRTTGDWLADTGFFLFATGFSVLTADAVMPGDMSERAFFLDQLVGSLACAAVFLRRRWPVHLAVVLLLAGMLSHFVTGATMVALFTVASRCTPRTTAWVAAMTLTPLPLSLLRGDLRDDLTSASVLTFFALIAGSVGWGLYVRSRRQVVASLHERAEHAVGEARRQAREEIAREMHDVLAHRLSLLSVHAGALEFRPDAPLDEIQRAAGVIRDSAHRALEDLRDVVGVLRAAPEEGRPTPVLENLEQLAAESRAAGLRVALDQRVEQPTAVPALTGRTVYRVVQESLTNARKHAPDGADVTVTVSGGPREGLTVVVRNPVGTGASGPEIPGAGHGLIGLAERTRLVGGRLAHGRRGAQFQLSAWLPWTN